MKFETEVWSIEKALTSYLNSELDRDELIESFAREGAAATVVEAKYEPSAEAEDWSAV